MSFFYIEVEFADHDDITTTDSVGPYRSKAVADRDCASLERTIRAHPTKNLNRFLSVMVRSFLPLPQLRKEIVEYLDDDPGPATSY